MRVVALSLVLLGLVGAPEIGAQHEEEDETEEQRLRDEAYLERYRQQAEAPKTEPADPEQIARTYAERAEALIRDKNHRSIEVEHYRVDTDDPRVDVRVAATLLESVYLFFDEMWPVPENRSEAPPSRVFMFYSYHDYNQMIGGDWSRQMLRPKGHFGSTLGALVVHTDSDSTGGLANTLAHEAAHERIATRLYEGRPAAAWITEGLATYYENTWMDSGGFEAGKVGGKKVALVRGEGERASSTAGTQLDVARKSLRRAASSETPASVRVVSADQPQEFYNDDVQAMYALSWILIHFLLHGEEGAHAEAFRAYVALDAEGQAAPDLFFAGVGLSGAELDEALRRYVKTIRVR